MEQFLHDKCVHCTCMTFEHESYTHMDKHYFTEFRQCIISMNVPKINESFKFNCLMLTIKEEICRVVGIKNQIAFKLQ